jgi:hypothetical protein
MVFGSYSLTGMLQIGCAKVADTTMSDRQFRSDTRL